MNASEVKIDECSIESETEIIDANVSIAYF